MGRHETHESLESKIQKVLGMNAGYVLDVYRRYRVHPEVVSERWRLYFSQLESGQRAPGDFPSPDKPGVGALVVDNSEEIALRGSAARIVSNMEASRDVPSATSYRSLPAKLLEENRQLINAHLKVKNQGKVSFTHLIAWALVKSLGKNPAINDSYQEKDGKPFRIRKQHVNLGLAIDVPKRDGTRTLLVPCIQHANDMDFHSFFAAYNTLVTKARANRLMPDDFQGTTLTLTNPGTVGTSMSVPRLMVGQGAIIATGAIGYPAENRGMSPHVLSELGISRSMKISCTYDHRIIQGAESGLFLKLIEDLLQGQDMFYDDVFASLSIPYKPVVWQPDYNPKITGGSNLSDEAVIKHAGVMQLINAYRVRGHLIADLDPLGSEPQYHPELDPSYYGLSIWDLDRQFVTVGLLGEGSRKDVERASLREILEMVRATYCGRIGVEYMNIQDPREKKWLQDRMEPTRNNAPIPTDQKQRILDQLISAEAFEKFLHQRYVGHKRFSLEGGETLIPILNQLMEEAGKVGVTECVMGMSHRGRLTVVTQTIGKPYERIFSEFQGNPDPFSPQGSGDVKYHLGAWGTYEPREGSPIRITLSPNPSHLEAVNPVVEGITRAKQEQVLADAGRRTILPVLIHGDAAFAGQGVVAETLNLSQLRGYRTGGTIHIIVNNQIGFTTPVDSARSSPYPTDVAKMCQAPIIHVNGDDPEACIRAINLAFAYRQAFESDVVLDMFCYRRHGHNEGDEPSFTQPLMYAKIRKQESIATLYANRLQADDVVDEAYVISQKQEAKKILEAAFERGSHSSQALEPKPLEPAEAEGLSGPPTPRATAVPQDTLRDIIAALLEPPPGVDVHTKLKRFMDQRRRVMETGLGVDWALGEALAFGSLVREGVPVRLSGEDSARGTFSQRHLILYDDDTAANWCGLSTLSQDQAPFHVFDSPLSEEAVLGFEYGYSIGSPRALVLWEAQFGDFVNEAQVVIDQFIAGGEAKWGQTNSVVLLLPHGYEGQGPEHSSARLERFLQIAAEDNIQVANVTTPAQYFHLLRRQRCEDIRKPLVLMTPKSLLRHPHATSTLEHLSIGTFETVIGDPSSPSPEKVKRVVFCSGKIFYDLAKARNESPNDRVAIVRIEQLYPFPEQGVRAILEQFPGAELLWVQEEPKNMGAWTYMDQRLYTLSGTKPLYAGRDESASTATGYHSVHDEEQRDLLQRALHF